MAEISVGLRIRPKRFLIALTLIAVALVCLNFIVGFLRFELGHDTLWGFSGHKWLLDEEGTIPAWYSSALMLLCAVLLAAIGGGVRDKNGAYVKHWLALSAIFVLMSLDEVASLHEMVNKVRDYFGASGAFYYPWVVPASVFLLVLGILYFKFLIALPRRTALIFVTAASIFVLGAIGMEMVGAALYASDDNEDQWGYFISTTIEETFELTGLLLFAYGLMDHLLRQQQKEQ
jgi:hypothetical protein